MKRTALPRRTKAAAGWRPSPFFWGLMALSVLTVGLGLWQIQTNRRSTEAELPSAASPAPARSMAPDFALQAADGSTVRLLDFRGQVVLLNFWATWCPPCKAEMPDLEALHREYGPSQGFSVVGINMEEPVEAVAAFARSYKISFPLLLDVEGQVANKQFMVRSLPTSMIIDREGFIRDAWTGQISKAAMLDRLKKVW